MVRLRSCRVIYYFDTLALGRRHQLFGRVNFQTWSLNFFSFFNLIFLIFWFFLSTSTRMRKICDFKNNALKVERVPKIFENLNSFETKLKMLKMTQIY